MGNSAFLQYTRIRVTKETDHTVNKIAKKSIMIKENDKINNSEYNEDEEDLFLYSSDSKKKVTETVNFFKKFNFTDI